MQVKGTLKRAPKWAWYTVGGVTLGAVAIRVWKGRAVEPTQTTDATVSGTPTPVSNQPSPVITPPVIIQSGDQGDGGALAGLVGTFTSVFGDSLNNAMGTIGGLAAGDQQLTTIAITGSQDIAKAVIAQGGSAPQPVVQLPPIQFVTPVVSAPTPRPVPVPVATCPATFPRYNAAQGAVGPKSCYKCQKRTSGDKSFPYEHIYQDGHKVAVKGPC